MKNRTSFKTFVYAFFVVVVLTYTSSANNANVTRWFDAVNSNNIAVVKKMIVAGFNINVLDKNKRNALIISSMNGFNNLVKILLKSGAEIHHRDINHQTALSGAAFYKGTIETVKLLILSGANIHVKDKFGFTPFLWSVHWNKLPIAKYLLKRGSNINGKNNIGQTAAILLSITKNVSMLKFLVQRGADLNIRDKHGLSCLEYAATANNEKNVKLFLKFNNHEKEILMNCYQIIKRNKNYKLMSLFKTKYSFLR